MRGGKIGVTSRLAGVAALFFFHFIFANQAHAAPVDIAATRTNVLNYITNLKNQPNNKVLSGQHAGDSLPTANPFSAQSGYASYITALKTSSGKLVAIAGAGYDALSPTIRPLSDLLNVNTVLKAHWNAGGLVEIGFATHNPWTGGQCGDINTTGHTLTDVATPGTAANINFVKQLDDFATALADLESSGVVALVRPFHEFNGNWFWWGAAVNGQDYINLWIYMHDYLTNTKGLKNLIWVWAGSGGSANPLAKYYPGSAYVDIVGIDLYSDTLTPNAIAEYTALAAYGKPFALAEYGPTTNTTAKLGTLDWTTLATQIKASMPNVTYFKAWSDYIGPAGNEYWSLKSNRNAAQLLADPWVVTADELPNFTASAQVGSVTAAISPAGAVTAGAQWTVDAGAWQDSGATISSVVSGSHTLSFKGCVAGYAEPVSQAVSVSPNLLTSAAGTYTAHGSSVTVNLPPAILALGVQWTIAGCESTRWYASGATATHSGSATVVFGAIPGYQAPANVALNPGATVIGGAQTIYTPLAEPAKPGLHSGQVNITVNIAPAQAVTDGAAWSLDGGNVWYSSGATVSGPLAYTITFNPATWYGNHGWRTPHSISGVTTAGVAVTKTLPYQYIANDYAMNGKSKVLFRDAAVVSGGALYEWDMNGYTVTGGGYFSASPGLASVSPGDIVAQADFDGDGRTDLLFQDRTTRALTVWYMNGKTLSSSATLTIIPSATEIVAGVGDFDGDGKADILLVDTAPGGVVTAALTPRILFMNATTTPTSTATSLTIPQFATAKYGIHTGWHVAAIADFDGDGKADILWRYAGQTQYGGWVPGQTSLWFMNGATRLSGSPLPSQLGAYQNTTSAVGIGAITGAVVSGAAPTGWLIVGTGDFNGDGYTDILYRYAGASNAAVTTGQISVWLMQGKSAAGVPVRIANGTNTADYTAAGDLRGSGSTVDTGWHSAQRWRLYGDYRMVCGWRRRL